MSRPADETQHPSNPVRGLTINVPIALLLGSALLLHLGLLKTLRVSSINMAPTLALDDHVVVHAWGHTPTHGDVVVYRSPFHHDHLQLGRIVAVAGDSIELGEDGLRLEGRSVAAPPSPACERPAECDIAPNPDGDRLDGNRLAEDCVDDDCLLAGETLGDHTFFTRRAGSLTGLMFAPLVVPEGHFFVLSDNRVDERDSRIYGAIPRDAVVGVLSFVYYASDETGIRWDRISRRVS